jgi:hypothetical protein
MKVKTSKAILWKAIRKRCMDCCGYQAHEVRLCPAKKCALWPYRFGSSPVDSENPASMSSETDTRIDSEAKDGQEGQS